MRCVICGKKITKSKYYGMPLCSKACSFTSHWEEILYKKDKFIFINGSCYWDGGAVKNPSPWSDLGFSGKWFHIRFFDGRDLITNNLNYKGVVPKEFLKRLPNNAEFIEDI